MTTMTTTTGADPVNTFDQTHDFHRTKHNKLSFSQISDYLSCRYKWSLRYFRGLHPRKTPTNMALGDAVHRCIAEALIKNSTEPETFSAVLEPLSFGDDEQREEVLSLAPGLALRTLNYVREQGWEVLYANGRPCIELDLEVPIPGFDSFICHIDAILVDQSNIIRIIDWKIRRTFMPEESEDTNVQLAIYQTVANRFGIPVSETVAVEIRNTLPAIPKLNKNGTMSKAAINTDWSTYRQALLDAGLDPEDYDDMRLKLELHRTVNAIHRFRNQHELDAIWQTIVLPVAREIARERMILQRDNEHVPVRNLKHFNCQSCSMREACLQALQGYDIAPLLTSLFTRAGEGTGEDTSEGTGEGEN